MVQAGSVLVAKVGGCTCESQGPGDEDTSPGLRIAPLLKIFRIQLACYCARLTSIDS
jgi:hypothetical protein